MTSPTDPDQPDPAPEPGGQPAAEAPGSPDPEADPDVVGLRPTVDIRQLIEESWRRNEGAYRYLGR